MTEIQALPPTSNAAPLYAGGPRLLADVGGTNARFALELAPNRIEFIEVLACADYPFLADAITAYLNSPAMLEANPGVVRHAAIAIANPVVADFVQMTNHHWAFSIEGMRTDLGFETLIVVNDFSALASALPHLQDSEKLQIGGGKVRAGAPLGLLGAGTGLGVSGLIPTGKSMSAGTDNSSHDGEAVVPTGGWTALCSEGGHVTFSPTNQKEVAVLQYAWREFEHVSAERLLSGAGLELIYRALSDQAGRPDDRLPAPDIARKALSGECVVCNDTIDMFCGMLGTVAGNLAVTLGAQGGIYIGGGIVPRLGERFAASPFRRRFEQKGRFVAYLAQVPTFVITAKYPAFVGVSALLAERLAA
jgi:glucokinase